MSLAVLSNTDSQTLDFNLANRKLSISGSHSEVDLSPLSGTDSQTLSMQLVGSQLQYRLSRSGQNTQTVALTGLNAQNLGFGNTNTQTQTTLAISGGNALTLKTSGGITLSQTGSHSLELVGSTALGIYHSNGTLNQDRWVNLNGKKIQFNGGSFIVSGTSPLVVASSHSSSTSIQQKATFTLTDSDAAINGLTIGKGGGQNSTNTTIGYQTLFNNTTASNNTAVGTRALFSNTIGNSNTAVGNHVLFSNISGYNNTALGYRALQRNTTGHSNTALGLYALTANVTGYLNTAVGMNALQKNLGIRNTAVGQDAMRNHIQGSRNVAIGLGAGLQIANSSAASVTHDSTFLGYYTRAKANNETNQIVIGYEAIGNGSNSVTLGNDHIQKTILKGNVGIGTVTPSHTLTVVGDINATGDFLKNGTAFNHPDYVFEHYFDKSSKARPDYHRLSLAEVALFIKENKHLPGVQSRAVIEEHKTWNVSENVRSNLEKVEELYLYIIEQQQQIDALLKRIVALEKTP